ncbi:hypothetical protein HX747_04910 [Streptomyces sp. L06]|nr:hypothetical protein [Streptomyces sp. L06]
MMDRKAVLEALLVAGSPYWRLKQVMDAWCALWFWPLEEVPLLDGTAPDYFNGAQDLKKLSKGAHGRKVALRNLDEWIEFAESVIGRVDVEPGKDTGSLFEMPEVNGLEDLHQFELALDKKMTEISGWGSSGTSGTSFRGTTRWYASRRTGASSTGSWTSRTCSRGWVRPDGGEPAVGAAGVG